jgi:hypothetical protein
VQCVSAPTRVEIDRFHQKGKYLDIGVPSVRNLRAIPWSKVALWWTLGLSSIPLHLMYNSAFFKSLVTNRYNVLVATEGFVSGDKFNNSWYDDYPRLYTDTGGVLDVNQVQRNISSYKRLNLQDCIAEYAVPFLNNKRHLVLVANQDAAVNYTALDYYNWAYTLNVTERGPDPLIFQDDMSSAMQNFDWICSRVPNAPELLGYIYTGDDCSSYYQRWYTQMDAFKPYSQSVSHCLFESIPERCSFSANVPIIVVVIISNFIKLICMYIVATRLHDTPLITIGDALESFLDAPDPTTKNMCLLTRSKINGGAWNNALSDHDTLPAIATHVPLRWMSAATPLRWLTTLFLFTLAIFTSLGLFIKSRTGNALRAGTPPILSLGLGRIHPTTLIEAWSIDNISSPSAQILASVLVANLPQTILSFLYLHLNGLATSMWLAAEYADFAHDRKTLRVSSAKGEQRSTHFLQLPYKIALPLMAVSGVLHWLLSQSIFLAVVAQYGNTGELLNSVAVATCGYSPLGMILTVTVGFVLVAGTLAVAWFRKLKGGMPLAGSCSAAISAACHRPVWDVDASLKAVKWGVVKGEGVGNGEFAHCSFSSGTVEPVVEGTMYAGIVTRRRSTAVENEVNADMSSDMQI